MAQTDMKIILGGQTVSLPEGFEDYLDLSRAVIVELDMHGGHLDPEPDCPAPSPRGRELVGPINEFYRACRALGVPVVHVVNTYRTGDFEGRQSAWRRITEGHYSMLSPELFACTKYYGNLGLEGTKWSALLVENPPEDIVIDTKKRVTAFETTDLDLVMRSLGRDVIVITGIMTNCCDLCSAYYAGSKDYKVIFCLDMTRGSNASDEAAAAAMVSRYIGLCTTSQELLGQWRRQAAESAAQS